MKDVEYIDSRRGVSWKVKLEVCGFCMLGAITSKLHKENQRAKRLANEKHERSHRR